MHHGGTARNNPTASFALSDFPALGIRSDAAGPSSVPYGNGAIHQQRENYVMDKEDFPSLSVRQKTVVREKPSSQHQIRKPLNRGLTTKGQMVCILQRVERMVFLDLLKALSATRTPTRFSPFRKEPDLSWLKLELINIAVRKIHLSRGMNRLKVQLSPLRP